MRRPTPQLRSTLTVCKQYVRALAAKLEGGSALEMDVSREQPKMMAGLDIGEKYCYLCLIDRHSGRL